MLTGNIRNQVNRVWNAFWSGGVSNPLSVIEQLTFLMFIKRLDDLHTVEERKVEDLGGPIARRFFPEGHADKWEFSGSQFKSFGTYRG
ncbi:type I restriction-modification system subunit M N-terminal domain-containing protein [Mameliella sp.]|uniref:type I restriction-modification system subunit M N-terminal domain-containing protein n=1 Tax=Mameliella sp. TaxID=1924940 RepID=UPI003B503AE6